MRRPLSHRRRDSAIRLATRSPLTERRSARIRRKAPMESAYRASSRTGLVLMARCVSGPERGGEMPVRCCSSVAPVSRARHIAQVPSGSHVPYARSGWCGHPGRNPNLLHQGASDEIVRVAPAAGPATPIRSPPCTVVPQFVSRLWRHNSRGGQPDAIRHLRALLHLCLRVERREAGGSVRIGGAPLTEGGTTSAEGERERLHPRIEELDLELSIDDGSRLSDQLIQPRFDHRAVAAAVHVEAVRRSRGLPVD